MTDYEKGYKDGMAGAALPNIIDNGDKIDGYAYSYKTDSDGVPYINIDCVRAMLTKAIDVQPTEKVEEYRSLLEKCERKLSYLFECEIESTWESQKVKELIAELQTCLKDGEQNEV